MKLENVGTVIATRELLLDGVQRVQVLIGKPQPFPDAQDWYCAYQVVGIGSGRVWWSGGVDPVQALVLALQSAGAVLVSSAEFKAGRLSWYPGSASGDLGFPLPKSFVDEITASNRPSGRSDTDDDEQGNKDSK